MLVCIDRDDKVVFGEDVNFPCPPFHRVVRVGDSFLYFLNHLFSLFFRRDVISKLVAEKFAHEEGGENVGLLLDFGGEDSEAGDFEIIINDCII